MKLDVKGDKGFRLLYMQERLKKGELLRKSILAERFGVTDKTIQRDIGDLREYFRCTNQNVELKYDRGKGGYLLVYLNRVNSAEKYETWEDFVKCYALTIVAIAHSSYIINKN